MSPNPPASETAAASEAVALPAMGALIIGCSIPRSSQIRVRSINPPRCLGWDVLIQSGSVFVLKNVASASLCAGLYTQGVRLERSFSEV